MLRATTRSRSKSLLFCVFRVLLLSEGLHLRARRHLCDRVEREDEVLHEALSHDEMLQSEIEASALIESPLKTFNPLFDLSSHRLDIKIDAKADHTQHADPRRAQDRRAGEEHHQDSSRSMREEKVPCLGGLRKAVAVRERVEDQGCLGGHQEEHRRS